MNCLQQASIPCNPFVLIRWAGTWEGRPCVDVLPLGLFASALTGSLLAIDYALSKHTALVVGVFNPFDTIVRRVAVAPLNFGGYPTAPIGIRIYGMADVRKVYAWLVESVECDGWRFEVVP